MVTFFYKHCVPTGLKRVSHVWKILKLTPADHAEYHTRILPKAFIALIYGVPLSTQPTAATESHYKTHVNLLIHLMLYVIIINVILLFIPFYTRSSNSPIPYILLHKLDCLILLHKVRLFICNLIQISCVINVSKASFIFPLA